MINIKTQIDYLKTWTDEEFQKLKIDSYDNLKNISERGIYIVFERDFPVYVGKTGRTGTIRLREMVSDYRSHTFNRKLMKEALFKELKYDSGALTNKTKKELIESKKISEKRFKEIQRQVNQQIRSKYKFAFIPCEEGLENREHWLIAILNPKYND